MKKYITIIIVIIMLVSTLFLTGCDNTKKNENNFKIVASFYPMEIILFNITEDIPNVEVLNMSSHNAGCIHNYTLKTSDLVSLENADVFVTNGLGIESFIPKVTEIYPELTIINASSNITDVLKDDEETNAHVWLSIDNYINQIKTITRELLKLDSANGVKYLENSHGYMEKITNLKQSINNELENINEKKCISFSESLAYLAKDMKLNMKVIESHHDQNGLSAETLSELIKYVKENNIKSIIIDEETSRKNAEVLSNETGCKIYTLKSGLSGNESKSSYLEIMESNLNIVKSMEE